MRLALACGVALVAVCGHTQTMDDVRARLQSPFHQGLYARTYQSLLERVTPEGYFEESLTGAYGGMFPRTVGGLVSLFLETGELDKSERLIGFVLRAMELNDMERVPHVLGRGGWADEPVADGQSVVQPLHPIALYRLDQPTRFGGAQEFQAPQAPLRAIELWLTGNHCRGSLRLELAEELDGPALATSELDAGELTDGGVWARFALGPGPALEPGQWYVMRASFDGEGVPAWWGLDREKQFPLGAGHGRDTQMAPGWMGRSGQVTAFALDTGGIRHVRREVKPPIYARDDQIDGQAHVIMAWARLALRRGPTAFEDATWPAVATLMDRSSDWPYLTPYNPGPPILLSQTGLVRNVCFEHSRDGRFWDTFDILTQSFMCAALRDMVRVAERRGEEARASLWQARLTGLERAVADRMTRVLDRRRVYLEMRLPDGGGGRPFEGMGWVNLAPVAAQWEGVDPQVMRDTMAAYRERGLFSWRGHQALGLDWWPDRPLDHAVIGKAIGWELVYSLREGEPERICEWLDLLEDANTSPLFMEAAALAADGKSYPGDPGNGEQCSWWCWGMSRARQAVGLSAAP